MASPLLIEVFEQSKRVNNFVGVVDDVGRAVCWSPPGRETQQHRHGGWADRTTGPVQQAQGQCCIHFDVIERRGQDPVRITPTQPSATIGGSVPTIRGAHCRRRYDGLSVGASMSVAMRSGSRQPSSDETDAATISVSTSPDSLPPKSGPHERRRDLGSGGAGSVAPQGSVRCSSDGAPLARVLHF